MRKGLQWLVLLFAFEFFLSLFLGLYPQGLPPWFRRYVYQAFLAGALFDCLRSGWHPLWKLDFRAWMISIGLVVVYLFGMEVLNLAIHHWHPAMNPITFSDWDFEKVFLLCVLSPILEEFFFRDLCFRLFQTMWGRVSIAILVSSLIFMCAHMSLYPGAFLLGIVSCFLILFSKSIYPSIVFHSISNASLFFLPRLFPDLAQALVDLKLFGSFYR